MMRRAAELSGAALVSCLCFVYVTWPQAGVMTSEIVAHHDALFSIWRLAWIAHALVTAPLHLFDANIFYPTPNTLAFSDATLLEGLLAAPLFWAGVSPVTAYNVMLMAGFVCSGVAMFVLVRDLTGQAASALVAAAIFTMLPYRIEHVMHLELQWAMFIPLAFWALHRAVDRAAWRWGVLAGAFVCLQTLACVYYGVYLSLVLVAFVPVLLFLTPPRRMKSAVMPLAVAGIVAATLTLPVTLPYQRAAPETGVRSTEEIARYSATPASYFATTRMNRVWGWTADRWGSVELRLFPGAIALALGLLAIARRPVKPVILYAVTAAVAVELSLGLNGTVYPRLAAAIPPLHGFRSLSRFAIIASAALAVLAGFGTEVLLARVTRASARRWTLAAIVALMAVDYGNGAVGLSPGNPVEPPEAYKVIRSAAAGTILELPIPSVDRLPGHEPEYQAWSIWHWKPLINGYSGYYPPDYYFTVLRMKVFPEEGTLDRLRAHGVGFILVHRAFYDPQEYTQLMLSMAKRPELRFWGAYEDGVGMADIFELR
jgi:hypothetical protein